ncbi:unnamed protein product [Cyclocybe aegerita]|uniref:F-box domain-containing protein n=1 Tax=Cyclocybe aegerita TaxID=1973307 RepID=A0A8S0X2L0_CYCAE|nr:unnamed protein product [Cyclocybe aegerita]
MATDLPPLPTRWTVLDNTDPRIEYTGPWSVVDSRQFDNVGFAGPTFGDTEHTATARDASFSFKFNGTSVYLQGTRAPLREPDFPNRVTWECILDGNSREQPRGTHLPTSFNNFVYCKFDHLSPGEHTFGAKVTSDGANFYVDRIAYGALDESPLPTTEVIQVDFGDPEIRYSPEASFSTTPNFGNVDRFSDQRDATISFAFTGTSVAWYTHLANSTLAPSKASYQVDNEAPVQFDIWGFERGSGPQLYQKYFETPARAVRNHTLIVKYLGNTGEMPLSLAYTEVTNGDGSASGGGSAQVVAPIVGALVVVSALLLVIGLTEMERAIKMIDEDASYQALADIDTEIVNVEGYLERLKRSRYPLQTGRNHIHDPMLKNLPLEIVSRIFACCVAADYESRSQHYSPRRLPLPLILGAVCKPWREIAWRTPQLWTRISISVPSSDKLELHQEIIEQWLSRSGRLPLSLHLEASKVAHLLQAEDTWVAFLTQLIGKYSQRCQVIEAQMATRLYRQLFTSAEASPDLDRIVLYRDYTQLNETFQIFGSSTQMTSPTNVVLWFVRPQWLQISWSKVTYLELKLCQDTAAFEILQHTPQLRSYVVNFVQPDQPSRDNLLPSSSTYTTCPHLRHLHVMPSSNNIPRIIMEGVFPALEELSYSADSSDDPMASIQTLILRSGCTLKTFDIRGRLEQDTLVELLRMLPSLESLSVHPMIYFYAESFFKAFAQRVGEVDADSRHSSIFLPNLRSVKYRGPVMFSWRSLMSLLPSDCQGRFISQTSERPLSTISITVPACEHSDHYLDVGQIQGYLEYRQRNPGMNLEVLFEERDFVEMSAKFRGMDYEAMKECTWDVNRHRVGMQ